MGALLIGQSGGPTAVINSSLAGALAKALKSQAFSHVYGARFGLSGILKENFYEVSNLDEVKKIRATPAAFLGSVRFCIKDEYPKILEVFKKYDITSFIYIGGNDSMDSASKINNYFESVNYKCNVIGIPKTIDNDLLISHSPGYGSAAKYIASTIEEIYLDTNVYEKGRVTIVEIMGRDSGWLGASSKLASLNNMGPDLIYLPESIFNIESFLNDVSKVYNKRNKALVAVSEGIRVNTKNYLLGNNDFTTTDAFGHLQLGGVGQMLGQIISQELGLPIRSIELNLPQRCAFHLASKADYDEAYELGVKAVNLLLKGKTNLMAIKGKKEVRISDVANKVKDFPKEWIINNNQISDEYIKYALPLIQGEVKLKYKNGLPDYFKIDDKNSTLE